MKKSIATFVLVALLAIFLLAVAAFGIRAWKIPGAFNENGINLGFDIAGGSSILYEADTQANPESDQLKTVVGMMQNRLNMLGYTEAAVTSSGADQVIVEIPGTSNLGEAVASLGAGAVLEFKDADGSVIMDGKDVESAVAAYDETGQNYNVTLKLNPESVSKFTEATGKAAERSGEYDEALGRNKNYIGIYLDNNMISTLNVDSEINSDTFVFTGDFDQAEANYMAGIISDGQMPFALKEVQFISTGPALGAKALETGLIGLAIGILLVMILMIVYYKLPGVIAAVSIVTCAALMGIVLIFTKAQLTLSGIAGIMLSIGMSVDANIIIFERIKDELRTGKNIRKSVESGYKRAFKAVVDSHIVVLIAAFILWQFGLGPVEGFGVILFIGILASLLTAVSVIRWLLYQIIGMNKTNAKFTGFNISSNIISPANKTITNNTVKQ